MSETGSEKWANCQYHTEVLLGDENLQGKVDNPVIGCTNSEMVKGRWAHIRQFERGSVVDIVILQRGKLEDYTVQEALNRICLPCQFYSPRENSDTSSV